MATEFRCVVSVEGAPKPIHASPWGTKQSAEQSAEHSAANHRAMIKHRGWNHVVRIETREVK